MSIGKYAKRIGTKTADLATVPLNLVGGLFGNPFDPQGGHQVINTPSQIDYLNNLVNQSGEKQGILSYGDYGTNFNLSDLKDPTAFSTAMTMGGTGFTKADTGDITYSGGKYDFDGAVPFIDQGGLMGKAYNLGGGLANLVNDIRQRNPGVTGTDYFDDVNISQPPGTDVGIMSNLANLFGSSARADEPMNIEDFQVQNIEDRSIASVPSNFLNYKTPLNARTLFTPVREGITTLKDQVENLKDKGLDFLGSGKDLALRGLGSIIGGPVGSLIGGAIGRLKESPTDKFNLEIGREFGDRYGYKSALQHGNLGARQDPFGRNLASFAGNYEKNRMAEIARLSKLKELTQFQKDKLDFGKKYLEKLEQKRQAKIDDMFAQGKGGRGQDFTGGRFDGAGSRAEYNKDPTGFSGSS